MDKEYELDHFDDDTWDDKWNSEGYSEGGSKYDEGLVENDGEDLQGYYKQKYDKVREKALKKATKK